MNYTKKERARIQLEYEHALKDLGIANTENLNKQEDKHGKDKGSST